MKSMKVNYEEYLLICDVIEYGIAYWANAATAENAISIWRRYRNASSELYDAIRSEEGNVPLIYRKELELSDEVMATIFEAAEYALNPEIVLPLCEDEIERIRYEDKFLPTVKKILAAVE